MFYLERQKQLRDIEISKILIQFYKYVIYEACNKELKPSVLGGSNRQLFLTTMFKKLIEVSCGNMKATTQSWGNFSSAFALEDCEGKIT